MPAVTQKDSLPFYREILSSIIVGLTQISGLKMCGLILSPEIVFSWNLPANNVFYRPWLRLTAAPSFGVIGLYSFENKNHR